ncbi:tRNA pseudouridine synthase-like 1 isoform X2 [Rhinatrema bivittatum]|uniref:tRNA pseudouridine synthase-like 1 isoform X2 n=1 Tax=Rhinatrema bivittatum TaxID=194408 RepID=UPI00112BDFBE|nr:tRNA pseudouridine synthase-like 1 isoform X2 [Rhinatrema bivittatum]
MGPQTRAAASLAPAMRSALEGNMNPARVRYLIFFQYFGTKYSGVMETPAGHSCLGVQNYLERAAQKLKPVSPIKFSISSRTDSGVHALCNSAHADVQRAEGKPPFTEEVLVSALNYHLRPEPISVLKAFRVPSNFNARYRALSRTYVYRLVTGCSHQSQLPVFDRNLCWAVRGGPLNVPAMREAAQYLLGTHDFSAYRSASTDDVFKSPMKTLVQADITPSSGHMSHHLPYRELQFWELTFSSRSFLYKQVRRMTGILVAVGRGRLMAHHVKEILETRDPLAFPENVIAPPDGLFLKHVEYDEIDLKTDDILIS